MSNAMTAGDAALSDHKKLHKTLKSMIKDSPAMSWDMHWDAHRPPATAPAGMSRSATAPALGSPDGDHRKQPLGDLLDTMSHKKRHHGATMRRITRDRLVAAARATRKASLRFPCVYPHAQMWDISAHPGETQKTIRRRPTVDGGGGQGVFLFRTLMTDESHPLGPGRILSESHLDPWMPPDPGGMRFGEPPLDDMSIEALEALIADLQKTVARVEWEHGVIPDKTVAQSTFRASVGSDLDVMRKRVQRAQAHLRKRQAEASR